jgi:hypothetical protein
MELAWRGVAREEYSNGEFSKLTNQKCCKNGKKFLKKFSYLITNIRGVVLYKYEVQVHTGR